MAARKTAGAKAGAGAGKPVPKGGTDTTTTRRTNGGAQARKVRRGTWTKGTRTKFLAELAQTANVRLSARTVGMSEPGAYALRRRDAAFAAAWATALSEGYSRLEMLLMERAIAGLADEIAPATGSGKAAALSERTILTLLSQHKAAVREHRAGLTAADGESADAIIARLDAKLTEMHARLVAAA